MVKTGRRKKKWYWSRCCLPIGQAHGTMRDVATELYLYAKMCSQNKFGGSRVNFKWSAHSSKAQKLLTSKLVPQCALPFPGSLWHSREAGFWAGHLFSMSSCEPCLVLLWWFMVKLGTARFRPDLRLSTEPRRIGTLVSGDSVKCSVTVNLVKIFSKKITEIGPWDNSLVTQFHLVVMIG